MSFYQPFLFGLKARHKFTECCHFENLRNVNESSEMNLLSIFYFIQQNYWHSNKKKILIHFKYSTILLKLLAIKSLNFSLEWKNSSRSSNKMKINYLRWIRCFFSSHKDSKISRQILSIKNLNKQKKKKHRTS